MKKQVIYTDHRAIKTKTIEAQKQAQILNSYISTVEDTLKAVFSDEDKLKLKNDPNFITDHLRQFYQFPNASDEFNTQALGIDLKPLQEQHNTNSKQWNKYPYNLSGGLFEVDKNSIEERLTTYTDNQFQVDCVEFVQKLSDLIEDAQSKGILDTDYTTSNRIADAFRVLSIEPNNGKSHNLIPNMAIKSLYKFQ